MTSSTPRLDAYLRTRELQDDFEGFTADEINRMSPADYARMTGRSLVPGISTVNALAAQAPVVPAPVVQEETPEPEPVSVRDMDLAAYSELRRELGIGQNSQYGVGIFDSAPASKASNGRHFMVNSNVEKHPGIARVSQVQVNEGNLDRRPLSERFGTDGNQFRYQV